MERRLRASIVVHNFLSLSEVVNALSITIYLRDRRSRKLYGMNTTNQLKASYITKTLRYYIGIVSSELLNTLEIKMKKILNAQQAFLDMFSCRHKRRHLEKQKKLYVEKKNDLAFSKQRGYFHGHVSSRTKT